MTSDWKPEAGTLAFQMIEHFAIEPSSKLDRLEVKTKFNVAGAHVDGMLRPAIDAGAIAVVQDDELGRCWIAGPKVARFARPSGFKSWLGVRGRKEAPRAAPLPDPGELRARIEHGIPIPEKVPSALMRYDATLSVMSPGDSFTVDKDVSRKFMKTVSDWAKRHDRRFLLRDVDASTSRIWRIDGMADVPETAVVQPRRGGRKAKGTVEAKLGAAL
jgi:hypothetical protein